MNANTQLTFNFEPLAFNKLLVAQKILLIDCNIVAIDRGVSMLLITQDSADTVDAIMAYCKACEEEIHAL